MDGNNIQQSFPAVCKTQFAHAASRIYFPFPIYIYKKTYNKTYHERNASKSKLRSHFGKNGDGQTTGKVAAVTVVHRPNRHGFQRNQRP